MDDLLQQLMGYARGMWRRRWPGLAVAWAVAIVGAILLFRMPDKYEASARVYVDTESVLKPLMSGLAVQPDVDQQIAILSRTLISRPNVEKLIRMTDLDLGVTSTRDKESLVESLMQTLQVKGGGRENLYTISYRHTNPSEAKRVVQALLSIFVESGIGDKRNSSDTARRFIDEQIKVYEAKLEEAENRLKDFKLKYMGFYGGEGRDYFSQLAQLSDQISVARLELRASQQARDALKRELAGEEPIYLPEGADATLSGPLPEIDARIDTLKRQLDDMMRTYTDKHPDVVGTKRVIESLEEQKRKDLTEIASRKKADGTPQRPVNNNPVFQQIKIQLAETEANVAALEGRASELQTRYDRLKATAQMRPQIEAEFTQLNRDYDVQKRNYEALVSRRESAALGGEMDAAAAVADFRIIDPPAASPNPVAPNRSLLLPAVLLIALGAGLFVSFVMSQVLPTFHDARGLREAVQRPVLGTVSMLSTPTVARQRRRSVLMFAGGVAGLVAVYGVALLLLTMSAPRL
ncbi:MAG TPA: XrtA system polysaccharide chain length determinant [Burkholderiales bacterium]|nr:XrtA system polysaccharide chain length determinant [Burkholderiales bacterium]